VCRQPGQALSVGNKQNAFFINPAVILILNNIQTHNQAAIKTVAWAAHN